MEKTADESARTPPERAGNLVLIGMPGCGKSTVGVVLAKMLGYRFIDADLVIQEREGQVLHEILARAGREGFREIEEEALCSLSPRQTVIATGGSAVYCPRAMEHLRAQGKTVYLRLPLETLRQRLGDLSERGVSMTEGQTLADLYAERVPLYEHWADLVLDSEGMDIRETVLALRELLRGV